MCAYQGHEPFTELLEVIQNFPFEVSLNCEPRCFPRSGGLGGGCWAQQTILQVPCHDKKQYTSCHLPSILILTQRWTRAPLPSRSFDLPCPRSIPRMGLKRKAGLLVAELILPERLRGTEYTPFFMRPSE